MKFAAAWFTRSIFIASIFLYWSCSSESDAKDTYVPDLDGDGISDGDDNCVDIPNPNQADADSDGTGNACELNAVFSPTFTVLLADLTRTSPGDTFFSVIGGQDVFQNDAWAEFGFLATVPLQSGAESVGTLVPTWTHASFDGGYFNLVDVMPNGHILGVRGEGGGRILVEIDPVTATTVRRYDDVMYDHDALVLPDGNLLAIWSDEGPFAPLNGAGVQFENVRVMTPEGKALWDWSLMAHAPDAPFSETYLSVTKLWSNCNAIDFAPKTGWTAGTPLEGDIFLACRLHNRLYRIDYPTGNIVWIMGDEGDFGEGLFYHPHDSQVTFDVDAAGNRTHTRILMYDNREGPVLGSAEPCPPDETCPADMAPYSRVMEVRVDDGTLTPEIVWKWPSPAAADFDAYAVYSPIAGGVSRLPNGNLLITHASVGGNPYIAETVHGRLMEVQRDGSLTGATVVWDMKFSDDYGTFKAIRLPEGTTTNWTSLALNPADIPEK
ncbi:MAG: aryl-sulfate sulfotransferase [Deltaproteobacteria bacterium]|nr:aryl-sulfate sulfotransferase [Deltaproteobacteria bacterium]